jgi:hypothetical protein
MTETEFENQILAALNEIDAGRGAQLPANAWTSVLDRFARTLSRHRSIGASVEPVPELPGGLRLVTWPKLRRDESTPMLNFTSKGGALILLGEGRREFGSAEELETYLAQDFLRGSAFPDTLAVYEETCALPVRGFLRKGKPNETSLADVPVHLLPAEQRKLAEAVPGAELSVMPHEDRIPLTSLFIGGESYASLIAGGYGMWVQLASRADEAGRLNIVGVAMSADELL